MNAYPIEEVEGRVISYMDRPALALLAEVASRMLFVPVTTRTLAQFGRLHLWQSLRPKYAVTSNGGQILVDGRPDPAWTRRMLSAVGQDCLAGPDMVNRFRQTFGGAGILAQRQADGLFYYWIIEREALSAADTEDFRRWSADNNWRFVLQGRKAYLIPNQVNKQDAVAFLRESVSPPFLIAAGDSLLDLDLLRLADWAVAPAHGEIYALGGREPQFDFPLHFTEASGMGAAVEILNFVVAHRNCK